jgi:hypothetical protein
VRVYRCEGIGHDFAEFLKTSHRKDRALEQPHPVGGGEIVGPNAKKPPSILTISLEWSQSQGFCGGNVTLGQRDKPPQGDLCRRETQPAGCRHHSSGLACDGQPSKPKNCRRFGSEGPFCTCFGAQDGGLDGESDVVESSFLQHSYHEGVLDPMVYRSKAASTIFFSRYYIELRAAAAAHTKHTKTPPNTQKNAPGPDKHTYRPQKTRRTHLAHFRSKRRSTQNGGYLPQVPKQGGWPRHARLWGRKRLQVLARSPLRERGATGAPAEARAPQLGGGPACFPRVSAAEVAGEKRGKERWKKRRAFMASFSATSRTPAPPYPG